MSNKPGFFRQLKDTQNYSTKFLIVLFSPNSGVTPIRQIAFIGNNLNQLTKLSHQKNNNNELDNLALLSELAVIRQSLDDLKNAYTHKGQSDDS